MRPWSTAAILMGLRYANPLIEQLLEGVIAMEESTVYQAILRKGMQQGLDRGRESGIAQGIAEGIARGQQIGLTTGKLVEARETVISASASTSSESIRPRCSSATWRASRTTIS